MMFDKYRNGLARCAAARTTKNHVSDAQEQPWRSGQPERDPKYLGKAEQGEMGADLHILAVAQLIHEATNGNDYERPQEGQPVYPDHAGHVADRRRARNPEGCYGVMPRVPDRCD